MLIKSLIVAFHYLRKPFSRIKYIQLRILSHLLRYLNLLRQHFYHRASISNPAPDRIGTNKLFDSSQ